MQKTTYWIAAACLYRSLVRMMFYLLPTTQLYNVPSLIHNTSALWITSIGVVLSLCPLSFNYEWIR